MRVVVADDVMLVRSGLARLLATPGSRSSARRPTWTAPARCRRQRPDVAIVDIRMPPTHSDEGLSRPARSATTTRDCGRALSQYLEPRYAERLLADQPGGLGYLLKERVSDIAVLVDALAASPRASALSTRRSSPG